MRLHLLYPLSALAVLGAVACATPPGTRDAGVDAPAVDAPLPDATPDAVPRGPTYLSAVAMTVGGAPLASFANWINALARPGGRCRQTVTDTCVAIDCRPSDPGVLTPMRGVHAGDITVSAPSRAPFVMGPDIDDLYPGTSLPNVAAWSPGDVLTFAATGGPDVPAFSVRLTFPGALALSSPTLPATARPIVVIRRVEAFTARWTPTAGRVAMLLVQAEPTKDPGAASFFVSCSSLGAAGTGTIPAALLSMLAPNPGGSPRTVGLIGTTAEISVSPGGQPIAVSATNAVALFANVE